MGRKQEVLETIEDLSREAKQVCDVLNRETDRGVAIVAAAFLEDVLEVTLRQRFIHNDKKAVDDLLERAAFAHDRYDFSRRLRDAKSHIYFGVKGRRKFTRSQRGIRAPSTSATSTYRWNRG